MCNFLRSPARLNNTTTAMATETTTAGAPGDIDERVVLNVGGSRYEVLQSTLTRHPNTLLGTLFNPNNPNRMQPDKRGMQFIRILFAFPNLS